MSDLCLLGVDPGLTGALAFYFPRYPERIAVHDAPVIDGQIDGHGVKTLLDRYEPDAAVVELVGARPGQGVSSMFKFGLAFGIVRGVIAAEAVPHIFVAPSKWKKHFALSAEKEKSRALAIQTWPACSESFRRAKDDGRAEAALLARYGADVAFANMVRKDEAERGLFA